MTSREIRQSFLDFFASKEHKIVPSAPLVLKNDPTLMFTNSGMVQFKDYFLGNGTPPAKRIADTQKCLRVSGKHNDLEDVGFDGTHHTMFEMLGNWSFGDYFKKDAINWSWEFLHTTLGLPADRLYATVFGGDASEGLASDEEARNYWRQYLPDNQILDGSKKDNFWEMGAQGPCGPCSEIHFDFRSDEERAKVAGETLVNMDDPSVVEIWNNVFMQFERKADGSLVVLPAQHVDTGMGFERLCMVLQGKKFTYDTDIFTPFIQLIEKVSGKTYGGSYERTAKTDVAMRVVADHIRAVAFTIADGQLPSSGGAGYVIRRILRRAVRYSYSFLDIKEPFFNKLVPLLSSEFADVFPELKAQEAFVQKVILEEEKSFLRTLELGLRRFETLNTEGSLVKGSEAFEMFDTFGFPIDLTQLLASERGLTVDTDAFDAALLEQKQRSKRDAEKQVGDWVVVIDEAGVEFVGYDIGAVNDAKVLKYRAVKDKKGLQYQIVLNKTPFYPEGGGQVGDTGGMIFDEEIIEVTDTKKENDLIIHYVSNLPENIKATVTGLVDAERRWKIQANHSATHLLHAVLRIVLGTHVAQKGSLVNEEYLRFDISHFEKINDAQIAEIEAFVNQQIRANIKLEEARNVPIEEARKSGAMMLFGEKYGESVRMITFGNDFSIELCGGLHVKETGRIGTFKITSEGAIAAGVRRIEAVTGAAAEAYMNGKLETLNNVEQLLKNPKDVLQKVTDLQEDNKRLQKQIEGLYLEQASVLQKELRSQFVDNEGVKVLIQQINLTDNNAIKTLATNLEKEIGNAVIIFGSVANDKPQLTISISQDLAKAKGWNAGAMVKELAKDIKGGGGGQPVFATAGGTDASGLAGALARAKDLLK
jgi:alanyl-tRNA synthetase